MKKTRLLLLLFAALAAVYIIFSVITPTDMSVLKRYHISSSKAHNLGLSVALPMIIIWFVSLFGYLRFAAYADSIKDTTDGQAMAKISNALLVLALWLPISTTLSTLLNYVNSQREHFTPSMVIINNYINLLLVLAAFWLLYRGTKQLHGIMKQSSQMLNNEKVLAAWFIGISVIYTFLTLTNPVRQHPDLKSPTAAYYLPDPLLALTIILPYIFIWFFGISSVGFLVSYSSNVSGKVYRKAFRSVTYGIALILISIMCIRIMVAETGWLNSQTLQGVLLVLYSLVAIIAVGFALIAVGSNALKRIEEA